MAVPVYADLFATLQQHQHKIFMQMQNIIQFNRERVLRFQPKDPREKLAEARLRCDQLHDLLIRCWNHRQNEKVQLLSKLAGRLDALSPLAILQRGYSVARNKDGKAIVDAFEVRKGEKLTVQFHQGKVDVQVKKHHPRYEQHKLL